MNRQTFKNNKGHKKWLLVLAGIFAFAPPSFAGTRDDSKAASRLEDATTSRLIGQSPVHSDHAVGFESRLRRRRQLWTRHDDVPHR
jgi:hypothetical protein